MGKDRSWLLRLAHDVRIVVERSSTHPVEYAVVLIAYRDGAWHTVRIFDNAHAVEEHHEHRYIGSEKQAPFVTNGPVNAAIAAAVLKLQTEWADLVNEWETTR